MSHERNWWELPAWRDSAAAQSAESGTSIANTSKLGPLIEFNPRCRHERTSYDIVNCDACRAHTKQLLKLRKEASDAEEANAS